MTSAEMFNAIVGDIVETVKYQTEIVKENSEKMQGYSPNVRIWWEPAAGGEPPFIGVWGNESVYYFFNDDDCVSTEVLSAGQVIGTGNFVHCGVTAREVYTCAINRLRCVSGVNISAQPA